MDNLSDRDKRAQELAGEILTLAVNTLTLNMRFMDRAIGNLKLIPVMNCGFASGASGIRYSPWTVVRMYMNEETLVTRNLLHSILHNVLRHSFIGEGMEPGLLDLSADIAVENAINEMGKDYLFIAVYKDEDEVTTPYYIKLPES
jgi:predicted metal-dependent peptidase